MKFLLYAVAATCVFCLVFGVVFFVGGGFLLLWFKKYELFALIVAVPALLAGTLTAVAMSSPTSFRLLG